MKAPEGSDIESFAWLTAASALGGAAGVAAGGAITDRYSASTGLLTAASLLVLATLLMAVLSRWMDKRGVRAARPTAGARTGHKTP
jgi:predicted MFS family arabinose efflux permease